MERRKNHCILEDERINFRGRKVRAIRKRNESCFFLEEFTSLSGGYTRLQSFFKGEGKSGKATHIRREEVQSSWNAL